MMAGPSHRAHAEEAMGGTFTASQVCPAFQSIRKETNPGDVKVEADKKYAVLAKNKPNATHYRIVIEGAEPAERWVSASCGKADTGEAPPSTPGAAGDRSKKNATHVLAMGWQPAFCAKHASKTECEELNSASFYASHLSLHGLWPQPRGTQYCNVANDVRQLDRDHDWEDLPEPEMSPETLKRLAGVMPGVESKLQRHEWIVHGTCYGASADNYFTRAAGLAEAVDTSKVAELFGSNAGKTLSADAIRAAFDQAFGGGAGSRVTVSCSGRGENRKITELVMNLAGDVTGSAPLGDLMRAAPPVERSCPGGLVMAAPD
jgi:ribonuclease T2